MSTVYLHIGMPKTGTTAIQNFLSDNSEALKKHGICFPDFGLRYSRVGLPRNGHFLVKVKMSDSGNLCEDAAYADYQSVLNRLEDLSHHYDQIILSDEDLWRSKRELPEFWCRLKKDLKNQGLDLCILVYLRRQDNFVQSIYRQKVKRFKTTLSFHDFLEDFDRVYPLDYYSYMAMLSNCVGKENLMIRIYEREQYLGKEHNLFSDFLNIFSLSLEDGFEIKNQLYNLSQSDTRLELQRALSPLPKPYKNKILMEALYSFPEDGTELEKTSFFKPGEQSAYLAGFSESNARLARDYLGRENSVLFYNETDMDLPEYSLNTEELIRETIFLYGRSVQLLEEELQSAHEEIKELRKELRKEIRDVREDVLFYRLKRKLRHIFGKEN